MNTLDFSDHLVGGSGNRRIVEIPDREIRSSPVGDMADGEYEKERSERIALLDPTCRRDPVFAEVLVTGWQRRSERRSG